MQKEINNLRTHRLSRTCQDILLENSTATNGNYNIDPNLGSSNDAIKSSCVFDGSLPKTCVDNSTSDSQLKYLHLLHTQVTQTIHLPCTSQGPFRSAISALHDYIYTVQLHIDITSLVLTFFPSSTPSLNASVLFHSVRMTTWKSV